MPIFIIERNFADQLEVTPEGATVINRINEEETVGWLFSFLSADKKKTFCLYKATSAAAIRNAARRANIPVDAIVEVTQGIAPNGMILPLSPDRFAELGAP